MSTRWVVACTLVFLSSVSNAWWNDVACESLATNSANGKYVSALCEGQSLYSAGQFFLSAQKFELAAKIRLYEAPNFEVLLDVARAWCAAGDSSRAKKALSEFDGSLKIFTGEVPCNGSRKGIDGLAVTRMCSELLSPTYAVAVRKHMPQAKQYEAGLRIIRKQVATTCKIR